MSTDTHGIMESRGGEQRCWQARKNRLVNFGVVGEVGDEPSAKRKKSAYCHGPCTGQVWNGARVGVEVGKIGKAQSQVSVQGTSPSGDGKEARGAFPEFRAGATMLAGARNCHFQALKVPLGPSGLLPANKRWSVLREATRYLPR